MASTGCPVGGGAQVLVHGNGAEGRYPHSWCLDWSMSGHLYTYSLLLYMGMSLIRSRVRNPFADGLVRVLSSP